MTPRWLGELEKQVKAASEKLRELKNENRELKKKLAALEKKVSRKGSGKQAREEEAWQQERQEIRDRVEQLAKHLESLL